MLSVCSRPRTKISKSNSKVSGRPGASSVVYGGKAATHRQAQIQTLLAVPRRCRECGEDLRALEGVLHRCVEGLDWPFGGHSVMKEGEASQSSASFPGGCRVVRLPASAIDAASRSKPAAAFETLWDFVRGDLSHGFQLPQSKSLASGQCAVLLALRGRQVQGMICVERIANATIEKVSVVGEGGENAITVAASLGISLVWVRKTERKKGLASAMIVAARHLLANIGEPPIPLNRLAFSQTTDMGTLFAQSVLGPNSRAIPIFVPACM